MFQVMELKYKRKLVCEYPVYKKNIQNTEKH